MKKQDSTTYIVAILISCVIFSVPAKQASAWLDDYTNRKVITVDATNIDEDLEDFPLHISISGDTDIGGAMQDTSNYYDIRFTDTSDNVLPYEEESMSISSGIATGHYWVKTDLASTTGATIRVYYGKSGATDGSAATTTWNSGFKGVWHLSEGDSTAADFYKDSTDNDNDGTLTDSDGDGVASTTGRIAGAFSFSGDDGELDYIEVDDDTSLDLSSTFTLSTWLYLDAFSGASPDSNYSFMIAKDNYPNGGSYDLGLNNKKPYLAINTNPTGAGWTTYVTDSDASLGTWIHFAGVRDSDNSLELYLNGASAKSFTGVSTPANSAINVTFGSRSVANMELDGTLDEIRIESAARSADWIKFMVANSGGESDYELSYGSEQENINPTISTLSPADNATSVALDANLVITFDESVASSTGNITLYRASDDSVVEAFDVASSALLTGSGTTYTINPTSDLSNSTEYYVIIDATAFDDTSGNSFAGISASTTWSFTTVAAPAQEAEASTPSANGFIFTGSVSSLPGYVKPRIQIAEVDGSITYYDNDDPAGIARLEMVRTGNVTSTKTNNNSDQEETTARIEVSTTQSNQQTSEPWLFTENMRAQAVGVEVQRLQIYLNNNDFALATSGPGSAGNETEYFGPLTFNALVRYQEQYAKEILQPLGLSRGTGVFAEKTRAHVNSRLLEMFGE